ncbi:MAG: hypothetical protein HF314_04185 [Ignavibacteria bacterium]|jgi:hypothetical protein|nr:hypothetical protein [Ignavibacteria bacterium]MCU7502249.1 hypothetical protein [Ignavibacteria bacterium]MCU7516707.1 hypothetical protein [Ignavibacteria bacterium]
MTQTLNINPLKILALAALFAVFSFSAYAQDSATSIPPNPSIGQGQSNSTAQDTFFNSYASQFANNLARQTGLSPDKADKIKNILLDYYNDITDTRRDFLRGMQDSRSRNAGSTAPNDDNSGNSNDNATGSSEGTGKTDNAPSGTNNSNNQQAVAQDLMSEYQKADIKADDNIIDVFDNDSQKAKYVQVKHQWWQDVKKVVFSTANQNSGGMQTR